MGRFGVKGEVEKLGLSRCFFFDGFFYWKDIKFYNIKFLYIFKYREFFIYYWLVLIVRKFFYRIREGEERFM